MGYGAPIAASTRYETLGAATGVGTPVTSGSTANTFGSTITLGTASFDYDGIIITAGSTGNSISLFRHHCEHWRIRSDHRHDYAGSAQCGRRGYAEHQRP